MSDRRAVVVRAVRTPFIKSFTDYEDLNATDLATQCLAHLMGTLPMDGLVIDDVIMGCVGSPAGGVNLARDVILRLGLDPSTPGTTLTRACASSLTGLAFAADAIRSGSATTMIVGGVESLSQIPVPYSPKGIRILNRVMKARGLVGKLRTAMALRPSMLLPAVPKIAEPTTGLSMGQHCEQMAKTWNISREAQDDMAYQSHARAHAAEANGGLPGTIVPVFAGARRNKAVDQDNGIRRPPDRDSLRPLKPAFDRFHGTLSAGNSSFLTDGASAAVVMEESRARDLGFTSYVRIESHKVCAIHPDNGLLMAPPKAIRDVLEMRGAKLQDVEVFELHEAFAAQLIANLKAMESATFCKDSLGLDTALGAVDPNKLNIKGGSLAIGHPFAATGIRLLMGLIDGLRGKPGALGLASACAAGAMGQAILVERVES